MTKSDVSVRRVSIPYHVPDREQGYGGSNYPSMFTEDVAQELFPIDGDVRSEPVFRLSAEDENISRIVKSAFARYGDYGSQRLSAILCGFGNQTTYRLISSGAETFEVAPTEDATGRSTGFLVLRVQGARSLARFTWQTIPKNARAEGHRENPELVNRRLVRLPGDRVVQMRLPHQYRRVPRGLRALRHIGSAVPAFAVQNLNPDGSIRVPYDLEELKGIEQRAVATITRVTGWRGRGTFGDAVTGYYTMSRFLRFQEFMIKLRETVAGTINQILAIAGAAAGFTAVVELHHLPTLKDVAASRNDLVGGRLHFPNTLDQYSIYR